MGKWRAYSVDGKNIPLCPEKKRCTKGIYGFTAYYGWNSNRRGNSELEKSKTVQPSGIFYAGRHHTVY